MVTGAWHERGIVQALMREGGRFVFLNYDNYKHTKTPMRMETQSFHKKFESQRSPSEFRQVHTAC